MIRVTKIQQHKSTIVTKWDLMEDIRGKRKRAGSKMEQDEVCQLNFIIAKLILQQPSSKPCNLLKNHLLQCIFPSFLGCLFLSLYFYFLNTPGSPKLNLTQRWNLHPPSTFCKFLQFFLFLFFFFPFYFLLKSTKYNGVSCAPIKHENSPNKYLLNPVTHIS